MVSAAPVGSTTKVVHTSTSGKSAGTEVWRPWPARPDVRTAIQISNTEDELKLIRDMRRRNPKPGMLELWHRLRQRGYSRCPESLFRVCAQIGTVPAEKPKKKYKPKPYGADDAPRRARSGGGQGRSPPLHRRPELRLVPVTPPSTSSHGCALAAYPSNPPIPRRTSWRRLRAWYHSQRHTSGVSRRTTGSSLPTVFLTASDLPTLFEKNRRRAGHSPQVDSSLYSRHNGKVERSHREDGETVGPCHSFYSLFEDFEKQLATIIAVPTTCP